MERRYRVDAQDGTPTTDMCLAQGLSKKEGYHRKKTVGACRSGERHTDRLDHAPQANLDKSDLAERRPGYPPCGSVLPLVAGLAEGVGEREEEEEKERGGWEKGKERDSPPPPSSLRPRNQPPPAPIAAKTRRCRRGWWHQGTEEPPESLYSDMWGGVFSACLPTYFKGRINL